MPDFRAKLPLRRAGLVSPFGVGAIVDYADGQSLITAAIEHWPEAKETCPPERLIEEPRLSSALGVREIRWPPTFERGGSEIPAARFPYWQHCPKCHSMRRAVSGTAHCTSQECVSQNQETYPLRFIAICENGHIADIDWMRWVHKDTPFGEEHHLKYQAGRSASLAGITISCSCGKFRSLGGLFSRDESGGLLKQQCEGSRPWVGVGRNEECGTMMRAAQKGASNVYFAKVESAIFIPDWAERESMHIATLIEDPDFWDTIEETLEEDGSPSKGIIQRRANRNNLDADALENAVRAKLTGEPLLEINVGLKPAEYKAFKSCSGGLDEELLVREVAIEEYRPWMGELFSGVYLIPKLRETRVLSGFTRLHPPARDANRIQKVSGDPAIKWLPGIKVSGEGFLLDFDVDSVRRFSELVEIETRAARIEQNVNRVNRELGRDDIELSPAELLIHTFSHLVIRALCHECGYGSSALRERVYVDLDAEPPMAGVLIYTASGDSEGSLGGVVRQGEPSRLEDIIRFAVREAAWCSSDPVCMETEGQGSSGANLAACHACCLLPETACEFGNRLLDRATIVGTLEDPSLGFFSSIL